MLEYTPVEIAYARPFTQHAEIQENYDVSADRADEVVQVNFKVDMSHVIMMNLFLNLAMVLMMLSMVRR